MNNIDLAIEFLEKLKKENGIINNLEITFNTEIVSIETKQDDTPKSINKPDGSFSVSMYGVI